MAALRIEDIGVGLVKLAFILINILCVIEGRREELGEGEAGGMLAGEIDFRSKTNLYLTKFTSSFL